MNLADFNSQHKL